jgi:hypothetical protein
MKSWVLLQPKKEFRVGYTEEFNTTRFIESKSKNVHLYEGSKKLTLI